MYSFIYFLVDIIIVSNAVYEYTSYETTHIKLNVT